MNGKSKKVVQTERYVDDYIEKNGYPPTYKHLQDHFGFKSSCTAWNRCKKFRDKMGEQSDGMNYKYFISYAHCSNGKSGFGSIELKFSKPIRSYKDVQLAQEFLDKQKTDEYRYPMKCVILNYIQLKG